MKNKKRSRPNRAVLSNAARLDDQAYAKLAESLTDGVTPETQLIQEQEVVQRALDTMVDWYNPSPRLIVIVKSFCELGAGSEYVTNIKRRLGIDQVRAEFCQHLMLMLIREGREEALLHIANFPMPSVEETRIPPSSFL